MRIIWEHGIGDGGIEILEQPAGGSAIPLNDDSDGGSKTYRSAIDSNVTSITSVFPVPGMMGVDGAGEQTVVIGEGTETVNLESIKLLIDGVEAQTAPTRDGATITISYTPTTPLAAGAFHTNTISFGLGSTNRTESWSYKTTVLAPGTLFVEAEDFNFGHGQYDTVNPIGMTGPYPGGTYESLGDGLNGSACDSSDFGIDYFDNDNTSEQPDYRPNTPVEAAKRNGPAGFDRGTFTVDVNHIVGWSDATEWMNYTRDFPTKGLSNYFVYARMAHGDSTQRRGGILYSVQGDTTLCASTKQTTTELGRFSAPWTGGWDIWPDAGTDQDALIQMKDAFGLPAVVRLSGHQTLRFQFAEGAGDLDYLAFVPAPVHGLPPKVISLIPTPDASGLGATPAFSATIEKGEFVDVASASLQLDGSPVPATVALENGGATITYAPATPFSPGSTHSYTLIFLDTDTPPIVQTNIVSFSVSYHPFPNGALFVEAEDFNFSHGRFVTNQPIGMTGPFNGGAYQGQGNGFTRAICDGSDFGIDYQVADSTIAGGVYRPRTPIQAGKLNGPAGLNRQLFEVATNHTVTSADGSQWMNYTREFPEGDHVYKVMARMSHGDPVDDVRRGGVLSLVSGDPTQCADVSQTNQILGIFDAPWTGGWDVWPDAGTDEDALMTMKDDFGVEAVIKLSGTVTLRFQFGSDGGELDYLVFLPQPTNLLPPKIISLAPTENSFGASITPKFSATIQDGDSSVTGIILKLNGATVTPTLATEGETTTVTFAPSSSLAAGSENTYTLTFSNSDGGSVTKEIPFRVTYTPLPTGTLFIEAEDFNFGHGQYDTNNSIGMTGAYAGGTYLGMGDGLGGAICDGSDFGIDYLDNDNTTDLAEYRPDTSVEVGFRNGSAGRNRGAFDLDVNYVVGQTTAAEWLNYTRDFPLPTRSYRVYARMAHGDISDGILRGGELFKVNGDPTQCASSAQTTALLGQFSAPWTGGWDSWPDAGTPQDALIPMTDIGGAPVEAALGGKTTLRFQFANDAGDFDYLAFVPVKKTPPPLQITNVQVEATETLILEWSGDGTLQITTELKPDAIWQDVVGATSPYRLTIPSDTLTLYSRIKQ